MFALYQIFQEDGKDAVGIDKISLFINRPDAVGISVCCNTDIVSAVLDLKAQLFEILRKRFRVSSGKRRVKNIANCSDLWQYLFHHSLACAVHCIVQYLNARRFNKIDPYLFLNIGDIHRCQVDELNHFLRDKFVERFYF